MIVWKIRNITYISVIDAVILLKIMFSSPYIDTLGLLMLFVCLQRD